MYCANCGRQLPENDKFCSVCGTALAAITQVDERKASTAENNNKKLVGFSAKINDPAFAKYIKNSNRWSAIFSIILALCAVIGFSIYGETSSEMDNPQAFFIGLGIGGMFVVIALLQIIGRKRSKTWDGVVVDKKIEQKRRKRSTGNDSNDYYWEDYTLYTVFIRSDGNKIYTTGVEDDDTSYNYYQLGDRVRRHAGLNSYEKYDKSKDTIIFCNACASLNDITAEVCFRCKCPLLK